MTKKTTHLNTLRKIYLVCKNMENNVLSARVMQATVNGKIEWRVYYQQEIAARFAQYKHAIFFKNYLNENT